MRVNHNAQPTDLQESIKREVSQNTILKDENYFDPFKGTFW